MGRTSAQGGWPRTAPDKGQKPRKPYAGQGGKGLGPNKASGHKGGMGRQGSKRG